MDIFSMCIHHDPLILNDDANFWRRKLRMTNHEQGAAGVELSFAPLKGVVRMNPLHQPGKIA